LEPGSDEDGFAGCPLFEASSDILRAEIRSIFLIWKIPECISSGREVSKYRKKTDSRMKTAGRKCPNILAFRLEGEAGVS